MAGIKSICSLFIVALVCGATSGTPQYPSHPHPPPYAPAPSYKEPGRPYSYSYAVDDDYQGLHFSADEASDGHAVQGSYQVALPDGRTQNVGYTADHQKGYIADVSYKGVANHPAPAPYHPAPPVYRPAPPAYPPPPTYQ